MTGIISDNVGRTSGLIKSAGGGGGTWTLISTFTSDGSDATATFDSGIDSTYPIYLFKIINIHPETGGAFNVNFRDGSTAYDATKTTTAFQAQIEETGSYGSLAYSGSWDLQQSTAVQGIAPDVGKGNDESCSGFLWLFDPSSTVSVKHFLIRMNQYHGADFSQDWHIGGYCNCTAAIDGVQFSFASDDIQGGKIKMYGLSDS